MNNFIEGDHVSHPPPGEPWLGTYTGVQFPLKHPDPAAVKLDDICHALAYLNRFTGHGRHPISVLQHSLLVWHLVATEWCEDPLTEIHALLHDAHEAYTGDISTPVLWALSSLGRLEFKDLKSRIQQVIIQAFQLPPLPEELASRIKKADLWALGIEARDLLGGKVQLPGIGQLPDGVKLTTIIAPERCKAVFKATFFDIIHRLREAEDDQR